MLHTVSIRNGSDGLVWSDRAPSGVAFVAHCGGKTATTGCTAGFRGGRRPPYLPLASVPLNHYINPDTSMPGIQVLQRDFVLAGVRGRTRKEISEQFRPSQSLSRGSRVVGIGSLSRGHQNSAVAFSTIPKSRCSARLIIAERLPTK